MLKDKINAVELKEFLKRNKNHEEIMVHYTDKNYGRCVYPVYNPFHKSNRWTSFERVLKELVVDIYDAKDDAYLSTDSDFFRIK